jgi:hypothetical protein
LQAAGRRIPFAFLEDVKTSFLSSYADSYQQAVAYELNAPFSTVLAQRMTYFNNDPGADVIDRVRGEISQVRFCLMRLDGFRVLPCRVYLPHLGFKKQQTVVNRVCGTGSHMYAKGVSS